MKVTHSIRSVATALGLALLLSLGSFALLAQPKIDPLVLGLRDALYADSGLDELVDQLSILPGVERPIALVRAGKPREALALLDKRSDRNAFVPLVVRIFANRELDARAPMLTGIQQLTKKPDSRIALQGYRLLQEFDSKPTRVATRVAIAATGAIVEFGDISSPLVVAGYRDGQARLYYRDGRSARDGGKAQARAAAKALTAALGAEFQRLAPEKKRELPPRGKVRFVFLAPRGIVAKIVDRRDLERPGHPLAKAYRRALALVSTMAAAAHK